jgi:hypothetical protein
MLKGMNRSASPGKRPFFAKKNLAKFILLMAAAIGAICQTGCAGTTTAASKDAVANAEQFGASTSSLNLGNVALGDSKTVTVSFTNGTNSAVTIMTISISGPGFTASGIPSGTILNPGDIATLNVTFTPASTGSQTGSVTVTSNAPASPMTVALQASGVPAGDHLATLSWNASPSGVAGYFVYRSTNGGPYTKLNTTEDTNLTYTDSSVVAGQTYSWVVTAVTSDSIESGYSNQATATVPTP